MRAEVKEMKCWFAVLLRLSRITEYTVLAVGNCVVLLRLSEISLCCCSCREVCRVFTAVNDVMMSTAFIKFDVIIAKAVGSFVVLLRLSGISPGCCGYWEFHGVATAVGDFIVLLRLSGISWNFAVLATAVGNSAVLLAILSPVVGNSVVLRKLSRISPSKTHATAGANFARLLRLSGISSSCYGCREFRRVVTAVGNFAVLLRLSEIPPCWLSGISMCCHGCREFAVLLRQSGMLPCWRSGVSSCWYNSREFRCVAAAVNKFAVMLRLSTMSRC